MAFTDTRLHYGNAEVCHAVFICDIKKPLYKGPQKVTFAKLKHPDRAVNTGDGSII